MEIELFATAQSSGASEGSESQCASHLERKRAHSPAQARELRSGKPKEPNHEAGHQKPHQGPPGRTLRTSRRRGTAASSSIGCSPPSPTAAPHPHDYLTPCHAPRSQSTQWPTQTRSRMLRVLPNPLLLSGPSWTGASSPRTSRSELGDAPMQPWGTSVACGVELPDQVRRCRPKRRRAIASPATTGL